MVLESKVENFTRVAESVCGWQCSYSLYDLTFHLLNHPVRNLKRFGGIYFTEARASEHFNLLIRQSYRMTSQWWSRRLQETMQNVSGTM